MTPAGPAPSFSHEEIGADGAWVVGTFPAGSGVWLVETYNPADFDHQLLTDSVRVDATVAAVPFDRVLRIFSPTCAQLDVRREGEEQPSGGGDLHREGCQETPPAPPVTPPPPTTAPPTTPPPAPAAPPAAPPVADSPPPVDTPVADTPPTADTPVDVNAPVTPDTPGVVVGTPVAAEVPTGVSAGGATRLESMPVTGKNTDGPTTVGLVLVALGLLLTVPRTLRRRWSQAQ
jgi:outer membrane biosynthesis protein TonB